MTKEVYQKARQLNDDICILNSCLKEVKKEHHWITIYTQTKKKLIYLVDCKMN